MVGKREDGTEVRVSRREGEELADGSNLKGCQVKGNLFCPAPENKTKANN